MAVKSLALNLFNEFSLSIKKKFPLIIISTLFLSFLEMISIGIIVPLVTQIVKGSYDGIFSQILLNFNLDYSSNDSFLLITSVFFFFIFIFKLIYSVWHAFYQSKYIYDIQEHISGEIYRRRGLPILNETNDSSAEKLAHKILNETNQLTLHFSVPLSVIFSEIATVVSLLILLFFIDPLAASIFFGISISSSGIFYLFIRKKLSLWGKDRVNLEQKRADFVIRAINDGVQFNLIGLKNFFINLFNKYNHDISDLLSKQRSYLLIPKNIVEFFSIVSLAVCTIIYFLLGKDFGSTFITISLIAFIGMRIMPSLNKVAISMQEFRFAKPLIKSILDELKYEDKKMLKYANFVEQKPIYVVDGYLNSKGIHRKIGLSMYEKESIIITGPSGCGKSTLLRSMIGLNNNFKKVLFRKKKKDYFKIAFLNSSSNLFLMSLLENILLGRKISDEKLLSIINFCLLNEFDLLGKGGKRVVGQNGFQPSAGEIQRLVLARALVGSPDILILDESLSSLDNKSFSLLEKILLENFQGLFIHVSHQKTNETKYTKNINFYKIFEC